jgi:hypothetical protein
MGWPVRSTNARTKSLSFNIGAYVRINSTSEYVQCLWPMLKLLFRDYFGVYFYFFIFMSTFYYNIIGEK